MSRFRSLPALVLVVVVLGLVPAPAAQARPLTHRVSSEIYGPLDLGGILHHLWRGLLTVVGADGAGGDPNGSTKH